MRTAAPLVVARVAALVLATACGCATKVHVRSEPPGARVVLGEQDLGAVGPAGVDVEVPAGVGAIEARVDGAAAAVPRTDVVWWIAALAIGGAACCVPSLVAGALCLANPAAISAPLLCLAGGCNPAPCITAVAAPTWATLPLVAAATCLGGAPLALLFAAERPASEIVLRRAAAPAEGMAY